MRESLKCMVGCKVLRDDTWDTLQETNIEKVWDSGALKIQLVGPGDCHVARFNGASISGKRAWMDFSYDMANISSSQCQKMDTQ